jgi:hypothetical protein
MGKPNHTDQLSIWGRVCVVLTLTVIASQLWAMVEFSKLPHMHLLQARTEPQAFISNQNSRSFFRNIGGLFPVIFLSGFAGAYYVIKARVNLEDAGLAKWFYRIWAVSGLGGLTFYYLAR